MVEPLPFRIRVPKVNRLTMTGSQSIETSVDGLLHLEENVLYVEWLVREKVHRFGFDGVGTEPQEYPAETNDVPAEWLAMVRKVDLVVSTWITFRARRLDAFSGIPTAGAGTLTVRVPFGHHRLIAPFLAALEIARTAVPFQAPAPTRQLPAAVEASTPVP